MGGYRETASVSNKNDGIKKQHPISAPILDIPVYVKVLITAQHGCSAEAEAGQYALAKFFASPWLLLPLPGMVAE